MEAKQVDIALLKTLSPLDGLKSENLQALVKKTAVRTVARGRFLFKQGDEEHRTIYVLSGEIELLEDDRLIRTVTGGMAEAQNPLMPRLQRPVSARAKTDVAYISIDSDLLDVMLTWDQTGSYEVSELREDLAPTQDDWMTTTKIRCTLSPT